MKAILIDPFAMSVTEVEYSGNFKDIYKLTNCDCFTAVYIENDDTIFVDDEGLLKDLNTQKFFFMEGWSQPLAGKGLILGTDGVGDSIEPMITVEQLLSKIKFMDINQVRAQFG